MTYNISKIWVITGFFWFSAVALTFWNIDRMNQVIRSRERIAALQMIKQFSERNTAGISDIMTRSGIMFKPVQSTKMAVFSAENELKNLAEICDLRDIAVDSRSRRIENEKALINLKFRGSFQNLLKWIELLNNTYPYMKIKNLKMVLSGNPDLIETDVSIFFKFRVIETDGDANQR